MEIAIYMLIFVIYNFCFLIEFKCNEHGTKGCSIKRVTPELITH